MRLQSTKCLVGNPIIDGPKSRLMQYLKHMVEDDVLLTKVISKFKPVTLLSRMFSRLYYWSTQWLSASASPLPITIILFTGGVWCHFLSANPLWNKTPWDKTPLLDQFPSLLADTPWKEHGIRQEVTSYTPVLTSSGGQCILLECILVRKLFLKRSSGGK